MNDEPLVSIVTPAYNAEAYIEQTVRSVLGQSYRNNEHIVVDDGSTDETPAILARLQGEYDGRLKVISQKNAGQSAAINRALHAVSGEYVLWINADDILLPNAIADGLAAFQKTPDAVAVYGHCDVIDKDGSFLRKTPVGPGSFETLAFTEWLQVVHCAMLMRTEAVIRAGYIDPAFYYMMDFDLIIRLSLVGPLEFHDGVSWAQYREHPATKTSVNDLRIAYDFLYLFFKIFLTPTLPVRYRHLRRKGISRGYWFFAYKLYERDHLARAFFYGLIALLIHPFHRSRKKLSVLLGICRKAIASRHD